MGSGVERGSANRGGLIREGLNRGGLNREGLNRGDLNCGAFARGLVLALIVADGLVFRWGFRNLPAGDYIYFFRPWYDFIVEHHGFASLQYNFTNYNAPYLYLLAAVTYLPIPAIVGVKLISVVFDLVLVFFAYRTVGLRYPGSWWPVLAAGIVCFLPTVMLNSSWWAQCDAMYASLGLGGVYFVLRRRPGWACLFFGLAFAVKLQAIFLFPALLLFVVKKRVPWPFLGIIPLTYLVLDIPAVLLGASPLKLLTVYAGETGTYPQLSLDAPNIYQFLGSRTADQDLFRLAGIIVTGLLVAALVAVASRKELTDTGIVLAATVSVLLVPYFLPGMHERYFYLADALTVIAAFWLPRRLWPLPLLEQFASLLVYLPYLLSSTPDAPALDIPAALFDLPALAVVMGAALALATFTAWSAWRSRPGSAPRRSRPPEVAGHAASTGTPAR